nr:hypothetical protein [Escherichia coli]
MSSSPQLSLVSKQEAAAELLKRRNARASLHDFIQYINPEYITSKFSQTVCDALDQFLLDMMNGLRPILILGAPPQHGKSDIVSRYLPAYFFGKYPEMRVGALSYSADLAGDMNADVQRIMSTPEYRNIFPGAWLGNKPADGVAVKRVSTSAVLPMAWISKQPAAAITFVTSFPQHNMNLILIANVP